MSMLLIYGLICVLSVIVVVLGASGRTSINVAPSVGTSSSHAAANVDASLYSRQLLVYGEGAQVKLSEAHILVVIQNGAGRGLLAEEMVKNLALAGIGKISIMRTSSDDTESCSMSRSLLGIESSLSDYAKALNPLIQVRYTTALLIFFLSVSFIGSFVIIQSVGIRCS